MSSTITDDEPRASAAGLAELVLQGEQERGFPQPSGPEAEEAEVALRDMGLGEVLKTGGYSTLAMLTALNCVDELSGAAFGVLGPDIQRSFDLSDTGLGVLAAAGGFMVFIAAIPFGYLADRRRRTSIIAVASLLWALAAVSIGLASSILFLVLATIAIGIGKANSGPVQQSLLADVYPIEGRARVFAIHRGANSVGLLVGPLLAGTVAVVAGGPEGWRAAFVLLAVPGVLLGGAAFLLKEPERGRYERKAVFGDEDATEPEPPISLSAGWTRLKKIKTYYYMLIAMAALGFGLIAAPTFSNLVLERQFGLDSAGRGLVGSIAATGSIVGLLIGGSQGDRLFRRNPRWAVNLAAAGIGLYGPLLALALYMPNVQLYTVVAFFAQALVLGVTAPAQGIIAAITPYRLRSLGFALLTIYLALIGAVGGAFLAGLLSDRVGPRLAVTLLVPPATLLGAAVALYGGRFVKRDIALTVADLKEEQSEQQRVAAGGEVQALQVRNLDFSYGSLQVLFDVSIDVKRGEVLALLGTNGAGKSTLLRAISGLGIPDRGVVRHGGVNITYVEAEERVRRGIVQVAGGKAVFPSLTVAENLRMGAYSFHRDSQRYQAKLDDVLELLPKLRERLDQQAGTLSGGEQQMLAIAKGLLLDPDILLLDELSLGLAPVVVQDILAVVEQLKQRGITMVIVEQSVNVALSIADRAIFMEKGQVRFEGAASDLAERDDLVRAVFLGSEGG